MVRICFLDLAKGLRLEAESEHGKRLSFNCRTKLEKEKKPEVLASIFNSCIPISDETHRSKAVKINAAKIKPIFNVTIRGTYKSITIQYFGFFTPVRQIVTLSSAIDI